MNLFDVKKMIAADLKKKTLIKNNDNLNGDYSIKLIFKKKYCSYVKRISSSKSFSFKYNVASCTLFFNYQNKIQS